MGAQDDSRTTSPLTIGYRELISIPEWGIKRVRAKADTGARTSAIDVANIEHVADDRVRFDFVWHRHHRDRTTTIEAPVSRRTVVKTSTGHRRERVFVRATVRIGPVVKEVEFSLVCRKSMINRILLGRTALEGDFLVDPSGRFLLRPPRIQRGRS